MNDLYYLALSKLWLLWLWLRNKRRPDIIAIIYRNLLPVWLALTARRPFRQYLQNKRTTTEKHHQGI